MNKLWPMFLTLSLLFTGCNLIVREGMKQHKVQKDIQSYEEDVPIEDTWPKDQCPGSISEHKGFSWDKMNIDQKRSCIEPHIEFLYIEEDKNYIELGEVRSVQFYIDQLDQYYAGEEHDHVIISDALMEIEMKTGTIKKIIMPDER
ncbi:hypothetical protein ACFQ49_17545 [Kroppenstedtia eburnea]|uniref:Lipoprotein n=1 Tax=Kroppenstedtia eburnea TaxID=714067 RepID=A0A1N7JZY6_9BACL|nr:hypothetical protein [Kroppenstedtia eburnea]QKI83374.1 hypothetical protein GXN75_16075 [Kroppenstedtia eburnea]SIS54887.1 hypothetical protein SAMN05421790_102376 [Kroppenstedtia eburnea]